jgi:hypothetical protein
VNRRRAPDTRLTWAETRRATDASEPRASATDTDRATSTRAKPTANPPRLASPAPQLWPKVVLTWMMKTGRAHDTDTTAYDAP